MSISTTHHKKSRNIILRPLMKADFNDMSATFAKYQLTVTLDVDSDDILLYSGKQKSWRRGLQLQSALPVV